MSSFHWVDTKSYIPKKSCFSFCINIAIQAAKIVAFISKSAKKKNSVNFYTEKTLLFVGTNYGKSY